MKPAFLWVLYYIQNNTNKCSYFCLTSGVTVWYNAKCIKQNARIGERNERSGLFPLPYAVCGCSAKMALTDLIGRRRIGRKGGILQNKKRYPSKLRPFGAASRFSCSGNAVALPRLGRVTKNNCLLALWPRFAGSRRQLSLFITGGHCDRLRWSLWLSPLLLLRFLA